MIPSKCGVSASYQTPSREDFYCKRCSKKLSAEVQGTLRIYPIRFHVKCVRRML